MAKRSAPNLPIKGEALPMLRSQAAAMSASNVEVKLEDSNSQLIDHTKVVSMDMQNNAGAFNKEETFDNEDAMNSWRFYREFEEFSYSRRPIVISEFLSEWEMRLNAALSVGCEYTDSILSFKILDKLNLEEGEIESVLMGVDFPVGIRTKTLLSQIMTSLVMTFGNRNSDDIGDGDGDWKYYSDDDDLVETTNEFGKRTRRTRGRRRKGQKILDHGSRNANNRAVRMSYTQEQLQACVDELRKREEAGETINFSLVSQQTQIPRQTIMDRLRGKYAHIKLGRPVAITTDTEELLGQRISKLVEWGFPMIKEDIRNMVKIYLDSQGEKTRFVDNLPGPNWTKLFIKGFPLLQKEVIVTLKRSKRHLPADVDQFFRRFSQVVDGVPPSHVFNYDEINVGVDLAAPKVWFKRKRKHLEKVPVGVKPSVSVMFCANAEGHFLPPFSIYKTKKLDHSWCQGGPDNSRFTGTPSGLFDCVTFLQWLEEVFLPMVKHLPGRKVLVGDIFSSHLSLAVHDVCEANNISMVCLPANSHGILLPLNIGAYEAMEAYWRKLLPKRRAGSVNQEMAHFPARLKQLFDNMELKDLLISAFQLTGIYPCCVERAKQRIPETLSADKQDSDFDESYLGPDEEEDATNQDVQGQADYWDNAQRPDDDRNPYVKSEQKVREKHKISKLPMRITYTQEQLEACVEVLRKLEEAGEKINLSLIAQQNQIPRQTLADRLKGKYTTTKLGRPYAISPQAEDLLVKKIFTMLNWGFPLDAEDVRVIIKNYLDSKGKKTRFVDNLPGLRWMEEFFKKRPQLVKKMSHKLKRSEDHLSVQMIDKFFVQLSKEMMDVPQTNLFNYDEINLATDPGLVKMLFKRDIKHPKETNSDGSRSSVAVMFCGNATGNILPPFAVYKAKTLDGSWCHGGPDNARFACNGSGLFDSKTFLQWLQAVFVPAVKNLPGRKILVGDYISTHLSVEVYDVLESNDITLVCLPPNSYNILQPLNFGVFGPMEAHWRHILNNSQPWGKDVDKTLFPARMKQLFDNMDFEGLLVSAFEQTGLFPLNIGKPKSRVPRTVTTAVAKPPQFQETFHPDPKHLGGFPGGGAGGGWGPSQPPGLFLVSGPEVSAHGQTIALDTSYYQQAQSDKKLLGSEPMPGSSGSLLIPQDKDDLSSEDSDSSVDMSKVKKLLKYSHLRKRKKKKKPRKPKVDNVRNPQAAPEGVEDFRNLIGAAENFDWMAING